MNEGKDDLVFIKAVMNRECETSAGVSFPLGEYTLSNSKDEKRIWFCKEYEDLKEWAYYLGYFFIIEIKVKNYKIEEGGKYSTEDGVMRISEPIFVGDHKNFGLSFFEELKNRNYDKLLIWKMILKRQKNIDDFIKIRDIYMKVRIMPKRLEIFCLDFEFLLAKRTPVCYNLGEEHLKKPVFLSLYIDYYLLSSKEKRFFSNELTIPEKIRALTILQNKENITYNIIDEVIMANIYDCGINYLKFIFRILNGEKGENIYIDKYTIQERKDFIEFLSQEKGIYFTDEQVCRAYNCELEVMQVMGIMEEGYLDCVYKCSEFLRNKQKLIEKLNKAYDEKRIDKEIFEKFPSKFV